MKVTLQCDFYEGHADAYLKLYGLTYNVLKISAGMGSIKFSR